MAPLMCVGQGSSPCAWFRLLLLTHCLMKIPPRALLSLAVVRPDSPDSASGRARCRPAALAGDRVPVRHPSPPPHALLGQAQSASALWITRACLWRLYSLHTRHASSPLHLLQQGVRGMLLDDHPLRGVGGRRLVLLFPEVRCPTPPNAPHAGPGRASYSASLCEHLPPAAPGTRPWAAALACCRTEWYAVLQTAFPARSRLPAPRNPAEPRARTGT